MPLSSYHNAHANVVLKRIKASSKDVIMKETHIKANCETKIDELVSMAQKSHRSSTKVLACFNQIGGQN